MNEDNKKNTKKEAGRGGYYSEIEFRNRLVPYGANAIKTLVDLLDSKNPSVKLGAANTILKKLVPDLKAVEVHGGINNDGTRRAVELLINAGRGFLPATVQFTPTSVGSNTGTSAEIQGVSVASKSTEDNNSDTRDSKTGTS